MLIIVTRLQQLGRNSEKDKCLWLHFLITTINKLIKQLINNEMFL